MEPLTTAEPSSAGGMEVVPGKAPLLVTLPHTGTIVPDKLLSGMVSRERALIDTDWHIHELYGFVGEFGAAKLL